MSPSEWRPITPQIWKFTPARRSLRAFVAKLPDPDRFVNNSEFQDEVERVRRDALATKRTWANEWRLGLEASVNVLADMARQGWRFRLTNRQVKTQLPSSETENCTRQQWRARLHAQRTAQLREPAAREFVKDMERSRASTCDGKRVSIFNLMRDGRELVSSLRSVGPQELDQIIRPYIQFVWESTTCPRTGLRLMDIWRYFRHTWANPYQSIPGRTMMFLVRDAATEYHAIIGIGAISSAAVKMKARDEFIGWEPDQVLKSLQEHPTEDSLKWLRRSVEELIEGTYATDLLEDRILTPRDLKSPSPAAIARLDLERRSQRETHVRLMGGTDYKEATDSGRRLDDKDWERKARLPLFRSKRAGELAVLLGIRRILCNVKGSGRAGLVELLSQAEGRRATEQLARRIKAMRVGTAIADLTVCGAVAPYQSILGGKLVSMLAVSPEVVAEYRKRYSTSASVIASSMAGREVRRPAELVFVGTTSLYGVRPCQYDRVAIPLSVLGEEGSRAIRYEYIDATEGWGTFHFGKDATRSIAAFVKSQCNGAQVNYVFGEGANPKLRALRDGLVHLGFEEETLLNHGMSRLIYGVRLASNVREYLLGIDEHPKYLASKVAGSTEAIGRYWLTRWVSKRLQRPETLGQIEQHTLIHPITHGARVQLPEDDLWQSTLF